MAKPLKFHQLLNQAPRSAKHGSDRRSRSSAHGYSPHRADHGAGGSDEDDGTVTITWSTVSSVFSWLPDPTPPAIPHAGIRTGELIAHRLWWVIDGHLCSLAHHRLWKPTETIYGNTNELIGSHWVWGGTYGFFRRDQMGSEIEGLLRAICDYRHMLERGPIYISAFFEGWTHTSTFVAGTIKMWGDVVEHERGYRAEYAKLNSIDELFGPGDIEALRAKYGVGPLKPV